MPKEWIDVADTAVKIGLGSLITGVFTYLGVKFSHKSEQSKYLLEHKVKVIEQIASEAGEYFAAWNGVISKIGGITKKMDFDMENVDLSANQLKWVKERDKALVDSWSARQSVQSKLRLLKAENAVGKFKECISLETQLRDMMFFDKDYPNYNQLTKYRKEARTAQRKFQEELAETYENIPA
ncbi:hypothetical protein QMA03_07095 [Pseudoalteromonas sp. APC 3356]|uniref:hypothetical protein n=1 Tax=unclassified Pseudoalteromonas TaxID=194690 RepID=UPI0001EF8D07|nr:MULTISPECIES: hypothetical protein [unclassified Pseudoalteromonas]ADT69334.1 hypothetical protein PSM_A2420 [Pseudoalteromonas sp. SM9913]MDN3434174.1 hypothetical protein [Pseudoalteromonas sp. APC 3356]